MNVYVSKQTALANVLLLNLPQDIEQNVTRMLAGMPAADVREVKRAKWIKYPCVWECSGCTHWEDRRYNDNPPPFCSRCGAEMG